MRLDELQNHIFLESHIQNFLKVFGRNIPFFVKFIRRFICTDVFGFNFDYFEFVTSLMQDIYINKELVRCKGSFSDIYVSFPQKVKRVSN